MLGLAEEDFPVGVENFIKLADYWADKVANTSVQKAADAAERAAAVGAVSPVNFA